MSAAEVVCIVLGATAAAGGLAWLTRQYLHMDTLRQHHEVGSAVFLQLGVVFATLLAFMFNEIWGEYNTTAGAISAECSYLKGAAIIASTLPPPAREQMEGAVMSYVAQVIEQEWRAMAAGRASPEAADAFARLVQTAARVPPEGPVRTGILTQVMNANQQRDARLAQVTLGLPMVLWVLLGTFASILMGCVLCFAIEGIISQVIFTSAFATAISFALVTVALLDYPFEGALRLSPDVFITTAHDVAALRSGE